VSAPFTTAYGAVRLAAFYNNFLLKGKFFYAIFALLRLALRVRRHCCGDGIGKSSRPASQRPIEAIMGLPRDGL
jgi:hypothetical protein